MAFLMLLNASFCTSEYLSIASFYTKSWRGLTICAKLGINLLTKLIFPKKDCIAFFESGRTIFSIVSTLSGSMIVPSLETMNPKSLPSGAAKTNFFGFKEMPYFLHLSKTCLQASKWSCLFLVKIVISSKYTTTDLCNKPQKSISMALWKMAPSLIIPKGILL